VRPNELSGFSARLTWILTFDACLFFVLEVLVLYGAGISKGMEYVASFVSGGCESARWAKTFRCRLIFHLSPFSPGIVR